MPYAIERYTKEAKRLYGVLDKQLDGRDFITGQNYTIADIACYPWIEIHEMHGINLDEFPNVKNWVARIEARPAVMKAYATKPLYQGADAPLDDEARKHLFGQLPSQRRG